MASKELPRYGGAPWKSQHLESRSRRTVSIKPARATYQDITLKKRIQHASKLSFLEGTRIYQNEGFSLELFLEEDSS